MDECGTNEEAGGRGRALPRMGDGFFQPFEARGGLRFRPVGQTDELVVLEKPGQSKPDGRSERGELLRGQPVARGGDEFLGRFQGPHFQVWGDRGRIRIGQNRDSVNHSEGIDALVSDLVVYNYPWSVYLKD